MPYPSAACQTCRDRRVKCDETKPVCMRCSKSRRVCVDTTPFNQASFPIHLENRYASGKTKRPRGPRASLTVRSPQLDLETRALAYYTKYHLQTFTDLPYISGGLSESVSAWTLSGRTNPLVDLALSSLALAVFSQTQKHPPAAAEASLNYHRLLQLAQKEISQVQLSTLHGRNLEAYCLAISLMSRYEAVNHCPAAPQSKDLVTSLHSWSHDDGAMAILKVWISNRSLGHPTSAIKQTRRGLIRSSLIRNRPLPDWIWDGGRFGEHGLELEYDSVAVRAVNLRHKITHIDTMSFVRKLAADELSEEAGQLEHALEGWTIRIPHICSYRQQALAQSDHYPRKHFYSSATYIFSRPPHAAVWAQYFATRMLINSIRLRLLRLHQPNPSNYLAWEEQRLQYELKMKTMGNSLASTIPFCLERVLCDDFNWLDLQPSTRLNNKDDIKPYLASLVVWPLTIASSLEGVDIKQQMWFRSELANLGRIIGDGVLEFAETDQWVCI